MVNDLIFLPSEVRNVPQHSQVKAAQAEMTPCQQAATITGNSPQENTTISCCHEHSEKTQC
jgi:hypothetical protein